MSSPYPDNAVQNLGSSGNVANATAAASLAAQPGRTNFLTGIFVSGAGATAGLVVVVTVTGLLGGTISFEYTFATGAAVGNTPLFVPFAVPLVASGPNVAITLSCPAGGTGNTNNCATISGYSIPNS